MNPLKLDARNRKYYEALVELHHADPKDDEKWLKAYRRVKLIKKTEGKAVRQGFRCFFVKYNNWINVDFAERLGNE